jgi:8-oxo-dGTP pyrophosphatase MutT (NUDIX family)
VLLDPEDRVLLFRYVAEGYSPFWIMPGGECDQAEDYPDAARRELLEETGISAAPRPIEIVREAEYVFDGEPVKSIEHFFHHRTCVARIDTSGHTELERRVMREHRWFAPRELREWSETIYPRDIAQLIEHVKGHDAPSAN